MILGTVVTANAIDNVRAALEGGIDVNSRYKDGTPVFVSVCSEGNMELIQLFLDHHVNVNAEGKMNVTALCAACMKGNVDVVRLLLEHGANPNIVLLDMGSSLNVATQHNNIELIRMLLERDADIDGGGLYFAKETPLMTAIRYDKHAVIEYLLKCGADPNKRSYAKGGSLGALHYTIEREDCRTLMLLYTHGVELEKTIAAIRSSACSTTLLIKLVFRSEFTDLLKRLMNIDRVLYLKHSAEYDRMPNELFAELYTYLS